MFVILWQYGCPFYKIKGFHALVAYRMANAIWNQGRKGLATYIQSVCSREFGTDIHPACYIGRGCVISSASNIVIGETAIVGEDCWISAGVTLGGSGK